MTPAPMQPLPIMNFSTIEEMRAAVVAMALSQVGVKELIDGSNPQIEEYHKYASVNNDQGLTDDVAWCSAFACWTLEKCGIMSANARNARAWLKCGVETKEPKRGDIVVFWRGEKEGWQGHVSIFMGFDANGNVRCLGGNQKDQVCESVYLKDRVIGYRTYQLA